MSWQYIDLADIRTNHFLQSSTWAVIRKQQGWNSVAVSVELGTKQYPILLLERRLAPGMTLVYSPYACSDVQVFDEAALRIIYSCLTEVCRQSFPAAVFLRWDLPFERQSCSPALLRRTGFRRAPVNIQAPDTVLLDLRQDSDSILAGMKQKTRYNIRLAERKGVRIHQSNNIGDWYAMYTATQQRQGMGIHNPDYYSAVFRTWRDSSEGSIRLYIAEHQGDSISGIIVLHYGEVATYLYGASSGVKRNFMAPHLLQWHAIRCAQEAGAATYDFFGIAPEADLRHPLYGLYRFKTGFGGAIIHRAGCWDIVLKRRWYWATRAAENMRTYLRNRKRNSNTTSVSTSNPASGA